MQTNDEIYLNREGTSHGPYTTAQLQAMAAQNQLLETDLAWHEGLPQWIPWRQLIPAQPAPTKPIPPQTPPAPKPKPAAKPKKKPKKTTPAKPRKPIGKIAAITAAILLLAAVAWWALSGPSAVDYHTLSQRDGRHHAPGQSEPFTGIAEETHPNGQLKSCRAFKDGLAYGADLTPSDSKGGRGAGVLWASRDGVDWVSLGNGLSPERAWGEARLFANELPDTLTGARRLFLKVELLAEGPGDLDYSAAQPLRTDATDRARGDQRLVLKAWWGGGEP